jgi:lipopolysaccharide/colanic/teichoic acid biosynthesis glycosyltransferase
MAGHTTSFESLAAYPQRAAAPSAWDTVQRALDVLLIAVTSPLWIPLLLLAVALKLVIDGRPVLFHHIRLGRNGAPFRLHKIRTTPVEFQPRADDWSDEDFPPRTRFGNWLRRFDLDELPQLWNVIEGEMSLVGPRPEMPLHAERFSAQIPGYIQRLAVRPGLTGLAQVRGWRGNTCIYQRCLSDREYLDNRRPTTYFQVLCRTAWVEMRRLLEAK